jgi:hypothetical protein
MLKLKLSFNPFISTIELLKLISSSNPFISTIELLKLRLVSLLLSKNIKAWSKAVGTEV